MSQFRLARRTAPLSRRSLVTLAASGTLAAGLPACSIPTRLTAVPRGRSSAAVVVGVPNERFFPTEAAGQADRGQAVGGDAGLGQGVTGRLGDGTEGVAGL